MLYWLADLSDKITFLNVFRYLTFRSGGAAVSYTHLTLPTNREV